MNIPKKNVDLAWKLYNYCNLWEDKLFGQKTSNNSLYMLILTLISLYGELTLAEIMKKTDLPYKDIFKYIDTLTRHYEFLKATNYGYKLNADLIKSIEDSDIKIVDINEKVLCTVISNMCYHAKILKNNLEFEEETEQFKVIRSLLNPVISNPIHIEDCRKLSALGYMKYNPINKILKLNEVAYKKDWVGINVI